jgi:signal transduction histidine kinase/CheY-like chemotaxis protein
MNPEVNKIKADLRKEKHPAAKAKLLWDLLLIYQTFDYTLFIKGCRTLLNLSRKHKLVLFEAHALRHIASAYLLKGNHSKVGKFLDEAEKIYVDTKEKSYLPYLYRLKGVMYESQDNGPMALEYLTRSIYYGELYKDDLHLVTAYLNLGIFYNNRAGNFEKALECYKKAAVLGMKVGRPNPTAGAFYMMGEAYIALNKFVQAEKNLNRALAMCKKHTLGSTEHRVMHSFGNLRKKQGRFTEAIEYYKEAFKQAKKIGEEHAHVGILNSIIQVYMDVKDYANAEKSIRQFLALSKKRGFKGHYHDVLTMQAELYRVKGQYKKSAELLKKVLKEKNETLSKEAEQKINIIHKMFEAESLKKEKELAEKNAQMRMDFLANMSHEIRSPMNAILGLTHLLKTSENEREQRLNTIQYSAKSLLGVINDVLDMSKIDAGKLDLENITFSISQVVTELVNLFKVKADEKGITLAAEVDKNIPYLSGDPMRINQVLTNLLGNAIKFTDKGSVTITVKQIKAGADSVKLDIQVRDTGIGINKNKLKELFEAYTQAETSTARKFGGTGLGLNISRRLAEMMGGKLTMQSKENIGTTCTFVLTLPVAATENEVTLTEQPTDFLSGKHILLVDDDPIQVDMLDAVLKLWNNAAIILKAHGGEEALSVLAKNKVDLIITDLMMPGINGLQLVKKIKAGNLSSAKIVALTAMVMAADKKQLNQMGFDDIIYKPFEPENLKQVLKAVLSS